MTNYTSPCCVLEGCGKPVRARELCATHYAYHRRHGSLPDIPTVDERFQMKVYAGPHDTGCWEWLGGTDVHGYGVIWVGDGHRKAHRYSWERANGPVPEDKQLDHICRNRLCVRPSHLRATTCKENVENHGGPKSHNTSGYRGVWQNKRSGKWVAHVTHNYIRYYLGEYATPEEANAVAVAKRNELFTHNDIDRISA